MGFAYQLFPKTVVRSAYGIFWLPGAIMETTGDTRAPAFSINTPMVTSVDGNLTPFTTWTIHILPTASPIRPVFRRVC